MSDVPSRGLGGRPEPATEVSLSPRDGDSGSARSSLSSSSSPGDSVPHTGDMKSDPESLVLHLPAKLYASQVAQIREEKPKRSATTPTSTRPTQVPPLVFPLANNFEERSAMPHLPPTNVANGSFFGHNAESNATLGSPQQYWDPNDASYVPFLYPHPPSLALLFTRCSSLHPPCVRLATRCRPNGPQDGWKRARRCWRLNEAAQGAFLSVFSLGRCPVALHPPLACVSCLSLASSCTLVLRMAFYLVPPR